MRVSVIIPVLNEAGLLAGNLKKIQWVRQQGHEVIVVDGGSQDESASIAKPYADRVLSAPRGRALQMNKGAQAATGDVFVFLHVDTELPRDGISAILGRLQSELEGWGRFDVSLSGAQLFFRVIETMMNWRSRISGIATGDQAIFISRALFLRLQGFKKIPLMEDVEICRRLKTIHRPICLSQQVITSSRRWELGGIYRTVWLMWRLRLAYWLGADPARLAQLYR